MAGTGAEEGDGEGLVDAGREEALPPGRQVLGGVRQLGGAQRRAGAVGPGGLDVARHRRSLEVADDPVVQVDAGQGGVGAVERVGEREPRGVEGHRAPQVGEHRARPLGRRSGRLGQHRQSRRGVPGHWTSGSGRAGRRATDGQHVPWCRRGPGGDRRGTAGVGRGPRHGAGDAAGVRPVVGGAPLGRRARGGRHDPAQATVCACAGGPARRDPPAAPTGHCPRFVTRLIATARTPVPKAYDSRAWPRATLRVRVAVGSVSETE